MKKNKISEKWTEIKAQFDALKYVKPLFRMIWACSPPMMLSNLTLRLLKSALPVTQLYVAKLIIDEVIRLIAAKNLADTGGYHFWEQKTLWTLIAVELTLVAIAELLTRGVNLLDTLLGDLYSNQSSLIIMRHAASLDLFQFENPVFYDKLERARRGTTGRTVLVYTVFDQAQEFVTLAFLAVGLLSFNGWLLLILLVSVLPIFIGESYFNGRAYSLTLSWTPERRELDYLRYIGASDETAKEVKIFNLAEFIVGRFKKLSDEYFEKNKKLIIQRTFVGALLSLVGTVSYYIAYVVIVVSAINGALSVGTLTFLASSFSQMRWLLQGTMMRFSRITDNAMYLKDYFDFLEIKPTIQQKGAEGLPVPNPIKIGFSFENVSFKYQNSEKYAVRDLTFDLKAGEKLALVGENGAGKTTVVKLLSRLYEPTNGVIKLDGVPLQDYNTEQLKQTMSIIFQDFIKFQMKANENIGIGNIINKDNVEELESAAHKSLADSVVEALPQRYEQMLGKRFNGGVDLSGGQWQKVALARAYMREAQLIILDEPTAALDARAEHEVFVRFSELTHGKTAVLISHRFSTVRMADKILFLENGMRKEFGTHQSLLEKNGQYAELFQLQAKGYV